LRLSVGLREAPRHEEKAVEAALAPPPAHCAQSDGSQLTSRQFHSAQTVEAQSKAAKNQVTGIRPGFTLFLVRRFFAAGV
jgi:hypothetical protein